MTEEIFWQNPYLTRLETRVTGVEDLDVTVAATNFYAESGGQESDAGTIAGHRVTRARRRDRDIVYTLDSDHGLRVGDPVTIEIEWARRYRLMRLHFAAEIVLELAYRRFEAIEKIGAHIAPDKARIDFAWDDNLSMDLATLAEQAAAIVMSDQAIVSAFSDAATERRYWQIREFPPVACGGTHLRRTSEVGEISLKRKNIGRGKERIEIYVKDPI
ncbi:MAG: alanyl-tRNA editing protein [Alphaproteobacteria bacterium]|nr:alanyl-tRNA editing protein [Alphaproteobacteria bacterium]